jgi:serine/threonine protein kinase
MLINLRVACENASLARASSVQSYFSSFLSSSLPSTEYLSPELIFNLGHNHASDLWALGVIVYEMLMAVTPFAPKRPDNVTELFTNIAMVKVSSHTCLLPTGLCMASVPFIVPDDLMSQRFLH